MEKPFIWDRSLVEKAQDFLVVEQARAWFSAAEIMSKEQANVFSQIKNQWNSDENSASLLKQLQLLGHKIDRFDAASEIIQLVFAASETTASTIMWIVDCLRRLHYRYDANRIINCSEEFDIFIQEVMRLYPSVPFVTRVCLNEVKIAGANFMKNEPILISIVGLHANQSYWSQPLQFQFPRKEFLENSLNRQAYCPFLAGPRVCGGVKLAMREIGLALKAIIDVGELSPSNGRVAFDYGLTMRPVMRKESIWL
jgi:cytochrome P450